MRVLTKNKFKINGGDHTAKKTLIFPVWPRVFTRSEKKWNKTPIIIPSIILAIFFFILSFFIDKTQPNRTIAIKTRGKE